MDRSIELSLHLIVYAILSLLVLSLVFMFFSKSQSQLSKIKGFSIDDIEKIKVLCQNLCKTAKSFDDYKEFLVSDYCKRWFKIKYIDKKEYNLLVKCWWWPINIKCEKYYQLITKEGVKTYRVFQIGLNKDGLNQYIQLIDGKPISETKNINAIKRSYNGEIEDVTNPYTISDLKTFMEYYGSCYFGEAQ
ncbi:NEQ073 [Nanoarchaeum equitans Kin4-M]|uniref:NEQ073 n=1 Tax=Nanoarchaeum equitans (strain Kin4-M) TaxID=228908 RepID=Q74N69_NANEQ|nr:NEQ073 [Nanoarchaeum equitans Kin4-M]